MTSISRLCVPELLTKTRFVQPLSLQLVVFLLFTCKVDSKEHKCEIGIILGMYEGCSIADHTHIPANGIVDKVCFEDFARGKARILFEK